MCGIVGFTSFKQEYLGEEAKARSIVQEMNQRIHHRGPDEQAIYVSKSCSLGHSRLSIIDLKTGGQPMTRKSQEGACTIVYNGEIYNMLALKKNLQTKGVSFQTTSDTEVILLSYMVEGISFVEKLNGIFSFALWDEREGSLWLVRDRLGVKPLFYTRKREELLFASEIKALFAFPGVEAKLTKESLCEVFGLGPAKTYGKGVFSDICEVLPGHMLHVTRSGIQEKCYWKLESIEHEHGEQETIEMTKYLVEDAVKMQMLSDVPICTFLSGGLDSSIVTAICSKELAKSGRSLDTYSFDFQDNAIHFKSNELQPSEDRPYVEAMVKEFGTNHKFLECSNTDLFSYLYEAVDGRDLPCMADVESSLLYFCKQVSNQNKVCLTGECADEIFGGYPWFHKQDYFVADTFPWARDLKLRTLLLKEEVIEELGLNQYIQAAYEKTIAETPYLEGEQGTEKRRRELAYLNIKWFMQTLLDRMDRTSMHSGLEARVPFADHRILEYVWNVPWAMKAKNGEVKALLKEAAKEYLPKEVLYRKKSPYPKTYDPRYEALVKLELKEILANDREPIHEFLDKKKIELFCSNKSDYSRPFYGQLMAGPQLLAYILQNNYSWKKYNATKSKKVYPIINVLVIENDLLLAHYE